MSSKKLRYKSKISENKARDKISAYGIFGEHRIEPRPKNMREVAEFFLDKNFDLKKLTEYCRNYKNEIPFFEVKTITEFESIGKAKITFVDPETHEPLSEMPSLEETSRFTVSVYKNHFESACLARDRAVNDKSLSDLNISIVQGISSIEAFINDRVREWNRKKPNAKLIDSKQHHVSLDEKINSWIPIITNGKKLDKSDERWRHFRKLRKVRDDVAIHSKYSAHGISFKDFAKYINMFRSGIAGMLVQCHVVFRIATPNVLINAFYMPDVEVYEENKRSS